MENLRGSTLRAELRGAAVAAEARSCDVLNHVRNAADCRGVISAQAVVEYPGSAHIWGLRGGFNIWQTAPSTEYPIEVSITASGVTLSVPHGFRPRQAEPRANDRLVDQYKFAVTPVKRHAAELSLV